MKKPAKKKSLLKIVSIVLTVLFLSMVVIIALTLKFQDGYAENKFRSEIATISGINSKIRNTFEGGTLADIQIPNKGTITVVYGIAGLEYITHIDKFDTTFVCPEDQSVGIGFSLRKNNKFQKWFPFQVNNLKELVNHYDDIVTVLNTFPHAPDTNYTIDTKNYQGKKITCSIYL